MSERANSAIYLAKAEESLTGAESEYANRRYQNCANRAYDACYQAAVAALLQAVSDQVARAGVTIRFRPSSLGS